MYYVYKSICKYKSREGIELGENIINDFKDDKTMDINWEQRRVLANPLRSRIVALLFEKEMTSKQVADLLEKNPGTIYYHIKQLQKNNIIEIDHIDTDKGIVEKFYRSKARIFKNSEDGRPSDIVGGGNTSIFMSDDLVKVLNQELIDIIFKYGQLSFKERNIKEQKSYSVDYLIKKD